LFNSPSFVSAFFDFFVGQLSAREWQFVQQCTDVFFVFVHERLTEENADRCLLGVLVTVALANTVKVPDSARRRYFKRVRKTLQEFLFLSHQEVHELQVDQLGTQSKLLDFLRVVLKSGELTTEIVELFDRPDLLGWKFGLLLIRAESNPAVFPQLIKCCAASEFDRFLPESLHQFCVTFSANEFDKANKRVTSRILSVMLGVIDKLSLDSVQVCFPVCLQLLLLCEKPFLVDNQARILKTFDGLILANPSLLSAPRFPEVLHMFTEAKPDPKLFVANFGILIVKLAASLFYDSLDARDLASGLLHRLFGDAIFPSLFSAYGRVDKYLELADSVTRFVSRKASVTLDDIELLASVFRPLLASADKRCRRAVSAFVAEVSQFAAKAQSLDECLDLITEFTKS
jgi:hypothetical protein